jgi:hypothetical protein
MHYIVEKERRTPVCSGYDVAVIGGGIAGVAAAVASARNGAKTCIIEKQYALGGLATLGNVVVYLPLCDGRGNQVIKGLGEELLKLSISDGYSSVPESWEKGEDKTQRIKNRFSVRFNPASFILALESFVLGSGVESLYDPKFFGIKKQQNFITHVIVENKEGRSAIKCKTVVDASGDADVCASAGEQTVSLDTNVPAGWFFCLEDGSLALHPISERYDASGNTVPGGKKGFSGVIAEDITRQVLMTRQIYRETLKSLKKGKSSLFPALLPTISGMRMTRRLKGQIELNEQDERKIFKDSIGMIGDWRKAGPVYYIPLKALTAVKTKNLITAGRCISSRSAWDITRVIPACAVTGEAAGTASAILSITSGKSFAAIDVKKLQRQLKRQNVLVDTPVPV